MDTGLEKLLLALKNASQNTAQQGASFEKLIKKFLQVSPLYSRVFESVWLWSEFPYNGNKHDYGIDLVARKKDSGEYCAIQCKFYAENAQVSKADVDTFISASGKSFFIDGKETRYAARIIISTTDHWSSTAEETIKGQTPPITRIRLKDLKDSGIDWASLTLDDLDGLRTEPKKQPRPHQTEAIKAVLDGFASSDRGQLIMACGTGKTFTALKIAEALTKNADGKATGNILFLVPSISLLNQSLLEWSAQCQYDYSVFATCSEPFR